MEQRRIIGYILLALAAVICLASNVWFIIKMPMGGQKVEYLLLHALPEVIVVALITFNFIRPQTIAYRKKLDVFRLRVKNEAYYTIDPDGYRYVSHGAAAVLIVIAFSVDVMKLLGQQPLARMGSGTFLIILLPLTMVVILWGEVKARLAHPDL